MGSIQQRRHVRIAANVAIRYCLIPATSNKTEKGRMVDVSEGGLCFICERYLAPGTGVKIQFADCSLVTEVRHCRLREYASRVQYVAGAQVLSVLEGLDSWKELTQADAEANSTSTGDFGSTSKGKTP